MKLSYTLTSITLISIYMFSFSSCKSVQIEQPLWINQNDTLSVPLINLIFESNHENWNATLYSFIQPISLKVKYTRSGFILNQKNISGLVEGPGRLVLNSGNQYYHYDLFLSNQNSVQTKINDYRSPKTVNPDSSLVHQKILFSVDENQNLRRVMQTNIYFLEERIALPPTVGIYRAQRNDPTTSFYVQPGSPVNIPFTSHYDKENNLYNISAGPLLDAYNNLLADGTLVTFIYADDQFNYHQEAHLLSGYAKIQISTNPNELFYLTAQVDKIQSDKLILSL